MRYRDIKCSWTGRILQRIAPYLTRVGYRIPFQTLLRMTRSWLRIKVQVACLVSRQLRHLLCTLDLGVSSVHRLYNSKGKRPQTIATSRFPFLFSQIIRALRHLSINRPRRLHRFLSLRSSLIIRMSRTAPRPFSWRRSKLSSRALHAVPSTKVFSQITGMLQGNNILVNIPFQAKAAFNDMEALLRRIVMGGTGQSSLKKVSVTRESRVPMLVKCNLAGHPAHWEAPLAQLRLDCGRKLFAPGEDFIHSEERYSFQRNRALGSRLTCPRKQSPSTNLSIGPPELLQFAPKNATLEAIELRLWLLFGPISCMMADSVHRQ